MKAKPVFYALLIAIICGLIVALSYSLTKKPIAVNEREAIEDALHRIISPYLHDNDLVEDQRYLTDPLLGSTSPLAAYFAYEKHRPVAVILTVIAPNGYNGAIKLLVGVYANGHLAGVRAIAHAETPGLGDKMEERKSKWIYSFDNKSLETTQEMQWNIAKEGGEFESWTGASITPKAIIQAVHNVLFYVEKHRAELFGHENR